MKWLMILVLAIVQQASGVIYRLNASEYTRLPALFSVEPYARCLLAPGDTYCYVDAKLVANDTSELLTLIQEYSAYTKTHFDHTLVHRGLCVSQSCRDHLNNSTNLAHVTEACLNETLYKSHGLQTRVIKDKVFCTKYDDPPGFDAMDYSVLVLLLLLVAANVAGTAYDLLIHNGRKSAGARLLLGFSARRNWRRLRMSSGEGPEPRLQQLKCLTGLKAITTLLVIFAHSPVICVLTSNNPEFLENGYYNLLYLTFLSATLIIQTFFGISGFLLAYNMLLMGEKRKIGWQMLLKGTLLRWLRLTPIMAVLLAFVSSWQRHIGSGPFWKSIVEVESLQCRRYWYYNLLYLNNYIDNVDCMPHTWYLAADMQLSVIGLAIFCLASSATARKLGVALAFVVGLLAPAVHTYVQDLNAVLIISPEVARNIFIRDPTFNNLYKRGQTNMICYAIGLAMAMGIYRLQQQNFDVIKYKKYRPLYWAIFPMGVLLIMSGSVFYIDGIEAPLAVRAVYSSVVKLIFGVLFAFFITGAIFKIEDVYRGVLEWDGWAPLGRIAYGAYLVHISVLRTLAGITETLSHNSFYQIFFSYLGVMCLSLLLGVVLWMMVEAPFGEVVKVCFYPRPKMDDEKHKTIGQTQNFTESEDAIDSKL